MSSKAIKRIVKASKEEAPIRRSKIYGWLKQEHATVAAVQQSNPLSWDRIASEIAAEGLKGARGNAPTGKAVRRVWVRVCRDLEEAQRKAAANPPQRKPNRPPANEMPWPVVTPKLATTAPPVRAQAPARVPPPSALATGQEAAAPSGTAQTSGLPPEVEAKLAAVREQFAHSDRYLGLPIPGKNR